MFQHKDLHICYEDMPYPKDNLSLGRIQDDILHMDLHCILVNKSKFHLNIEHLIHMLQNRMDHLEQDLALLINSIFALILNIVLGSLEKKSYVVEVVAIADIA